MIANSDDDDNVDSVINNVIPIFQAGRKPQETNFGQLPSSVILRLLTITPIVRYILACY